jgi:hypothetical protein
MQLPAPGSSARHRERTARASSALPNDAARRCVHPVQAQVFPERIRRPRKSIRSAKNGFQEPRRLLSAPRRERVALRRDFVREGRTSRGDEAN